LERVSVVRDKCDYKGNRTEKLQNGPKSTFHDRIEKGPLGPA